MENKVQNTILIGDENENNLGDDANNEDIFETIFNEIKENFKSVDVEEKKQEDLKKIEEKEKDKEKNERKKSQDMIDFVIIEKPEDKPEDKKDIKGNKSDEDDF